jgi:hypothetical protein
MLAPEYVTGLVEAIGSFTYSRSPGNLTVYFALRLPARDRAVLDAVREFLAVGRVYDVPGGFYLRVSRHDELLRVVGHFERHPLRGHRQEAFLIWKEMVAIKSRFRQPDPPRLESLAAQLSALAASRGPGANP